MQKKKAFLKFYSKTNNINMSNSDLNLILAPQQINVKKFCELLNNKINILKNNITLTIYVQIYYDKTFYFYYQILQSKEIIEKISYNGNISLRAIYELALYKSKNVNSISIKSVVKQLINIARLLNLNIIK